MEVPIIQNDASSPAEQLSNTLDAYNREHIEFINLATHDLDAPLRKLSTLVDMLSRKLTLSLEDKEVARYIERIGSCLGDMRLLIDDLSMLSKVISDKEDYADSDTKTIIEEVVADFQPQLKEKQIQIVVEKMPTLLARPRQLYRLFRCIIENAIKFRRADTEPVITIRSIPTTPEERQRLKLASDREYHKIEICDNGIGFDQINAEKIFKPFQRLHGKSQFTGNGIGLAVCRKVTENHGGIIYAEGKENSGACFVLLLPANH
ncbi:MAG: hypothetical protein H7Y42_05135 [Chitinophagaceae bacterium]|nr:hypothetical protein [Chitinophagaceae bacterium]